MDQEISQYLSWLPSVCGYRATAQYVLFGFRKNRARFPLISEPFMNYPG